MDRVKTKSTEIISVLLIDFFFSYYIIIVSSKINTKNKKNGAVHQELACAEHVRSWRDCFVFVNANTNEPCVCLQSVCDFAWTLTTILRPIH